MIRPKDVRLVIMTVARPRQYIHSTLASLLLSDPKAREFKGLHLVVGGGRLDYLKAYAHHQCLQIHPASLMDIQRGSAWTVHRRACLNYHRCLTEVPADCSGVCVCEDDVIFCDGFVDRLLAIVNELQERNARYILSAYLPGNLGIDARSEQSHGPYPPPLFFGTRCMYYPRLVVSELAPVIYSKGVVQFHKPYDMLIKQYASEIRALYGSAESLVQHMGRRSTGLGEFHASETFHPDRGENVTDGGTSCMQLVGGLETRTS